MACCRKQSIMWESVLQRKLRKENILRTQEWPTRPNSLSLSLLLPFSPSPSPLPLSYWTYRSEVSRRFGRMKSWWLWLESRRASRGLAGLVEWLEEQVEVKWQIHNGQRYLWMALLRRGWQGMLGSTAVWFTNTGVNRTYHYTDLMKGEKSWEGQKRIRRMRNSGATNILRVWYVEKTLSLVWTLLEILLSWVAVTLFPIKQ